MRRRWSFSAMASSLSVAAAFTMIVLVSGFRVGPNANAAFPGQNGRIAYVTRVDDHRAIWTVDAAGGDPLPLINLGSGRDAINPSWSWDGTRIAFAGQTSPGGPFAIYTANADGSGPPQQVTTPPVSDTDPTRSPTGGEIAFVRERSDGSKRIFIVDLATFSVRPLGASFGTDLEPMVARRVDDRLRLEGVPSPSLPADRLSVHRPDRSSRRKWTCERAERLLPRHALRGLPSPRLVADGSKLVVTFSLDEFAFGPSGVRLFDASSGLPLNMLGLCWTMSEPSFSPDGQSIVLTSRQPTDPLTGELSEPSLCVLTMNGQFVFHGTPAGSDAAWGPVPGSTPAPQRDLSAPTMTFAFEPQPEPGGWFPFAPQVDVTATDNIGVMSIRCTYDGQSVIHCPRARRRWAPTPLRSVGVDRARRAHP
jgi:hypothetical protein